jgi:hypothetical protein
MCTQLAPHTSYKEICVKCQVVSVRIIYFIVIKLCNLPTECICVFRKVLTINNDGLCMTKADSAGKLIYCHIWSMI